MQTEMPQLQKAWSQFFTHILEQLLDLLELCLVCIRYSTGFQQTIDGSISRFLCLKEEIIALIFFQRTPLIRRFVPFSAVAAADVLNMGITRKIELIDGINIYDEHGDLVGKSNVAGTWAVGSCIGGRIAAAAPILILPPTIMHRWKLFSPFLMLSSNHRISNIHAPSGLSKSDFSIEEDG